VRLEGACQWKFPVNKRNYGPYYYYYYYYLYAIELTPGGSSIQLHTNCIQNTEDGTYRTITGGGEEKHVQNKSEHVQGKHWEAVAVPRLYELYCSMCLTAENKQEKTSVSVVENCPDIPVAAVQYTFTHIQPYSTHSHTNSSTVHIHTQTAVQYTFTHKQQYSTHSHTNSSTVHIHTQTAIQYTFSHKQQYSTHSHTNSSTVHIHTQTAVQYTFTHKQQYSTHSHTNNSTVHIHTQTVHRKTQ
jgi:hypothetical protein